ncbi:16S rRNA (guanine(527)-N(7))-methyltransferase RsmG [Flavobacteriaceae bacterium]|nr:16S rRNA (guanine(527)-N(7))-methyltransferase RsmG [Flavobacteriaceae bacterium]CAI8367292.1 MAG: Ribosomal RNA small subunit methyltransferase G [Formosa sp. Hel3_A1_48]
MDIILKYFPEISDVQKQQFEALQGLYEDWNSKINVISRKDIQSLYLKHVLHSLSIAKVIEFLPNAKILDVGTGGGFPGIPLAILFPKTKFHLVDSIQKKIKVVAAVAHALKLENITSEHLRAEAVQGQFDFVVSRAVTTMPSFVKWVNKKVRKEQLHELSNGILYLKGGDLTEELSSFKKTSIYDLNDFFEEDFFETKKVVHLPLK